TMPASTEVNTEPLVDFPAQHRPPERVVRELRRIDPTAELVYFGHGRWLLGSVKPHPDRQAKGRAMLKSVRMVSVGDQSRRAVDRRRLAYLFAQGFRTIQMYQYEEGAGGPDHRIVEDFRRRDRNYRVALQDHLEGIEREIDGRANQEEATETLLEAAAAKAADVTKYAFRKAKSTVLDGFRDDEDYNRGEDDDG
ncbi:MAG: hypothetical protein ACOC8K_03765, partial [Gemmatimonadota bacterium]